MKNPIRRIEYSTSTEKISPEVKRQIDSRFSEKVSPLREERIKEVRAQITPISPITPKQPIIDKQHVDLIDKKKEEIPEGFHQQLKDSLMEKQATIVEENGKYCVKSHSGKNLGCSDTHEGAVQRLKEVEYFKSKGQKSGDKAPIPCRNCGSQNTRYWTEQGLGGENRGIECSDCGWGSSAWIEKHAE